MAYNVEFSEPIFDQRSNQWILIGSLHLQVEGDSYRTLEIKHWLSHEIRFTEHKFNFAKEDIKRQLEDRANRETRAVLQYRAPPEPIMPRRISIPAMRMIHPQLISGNITGIQPIRGEPAILGFLRKWRGKPCEKVNWKQEGF